MINKGLSMNLTNLINLLTSKPNVYFYLFSHFHLIWNLIRLSEYRSIVWKDIVVFLVTHKHLLTLRCGKTFHWNVKSFLHLILNNYNNKTATCDHRYEKCGLEVVSKVLLLSWKWKFQKFSFLFSFILKLFKHHGSLIIQVGVAMHNIRFIHTIKHISFRCLAGSLALWGIWKTYADIDRIKHT